MRKRKAKGGLKGRRWTRKDAPVLTVGQRDNSGTLAVLNPNAGTKNGERRTLVECLCGCKFRDTVRVKHFLKGVASCPTRRRAANRKAMERKQYIDRIKLVNALSKGKNLNEQAKAVAIRFATQMSKDPDALAKIGQWFKPDLAQRDVDRCKAVATKHGSAPAKPSPATVAPTTRKPSLTIEEKDRLCELGIFCRLEGRFYLTVRGEAWDKQSRPPVEEFVKAWESAKRQA